VNDKEGERAGIFFFLCCKKKNKQTNIAIKVKNSIEIDIIQSGEYVCIFDTVHLTKKDVDLVASLSHEMIQMRVTLNHLVGIQIGKK
jgi:hypothetical protein